MIASHQVRRDHGAGTRALCALGCLLLLCGCERFNPPPTVPPREPIYSPDWTPPSSSRVVKRHEILGHSVEGQPIGLTTFEDGEPTIFIVAGIHGDEPGSADVAHALVDYLHANPDAYAGRTVGIMPASNPDGLARNRRTNANGVDLNRNFPASNWRSAGGAADRHGAQPESEPETRAIQRAMQILQPICVVSIHSISAGKYCNNYDGPARELAELMAGCNGYPVKANIGHPTPGSMGSCVGIDQGIPIITLELPKGREGWRCWEDNRSALLALIRAVGS